MITSTQQTLYRLDNLNAEQNRISYQLATGKVLEQGSDDSVLYAKEIFVDDKIKMYEGLKAQNEKTTVQNNVADSTMSEIKTLLEFSKVEIIKGLNATTDADGKKAIATNLEGVKENLFALVNERVDNEYLFAGSDSSIPPFSENSDGSISYDGDNKLRKIAVEDGLYRGRGITGFDAIMFSSDIATKSDPELSFTESERILDEDGYEWKLNAAKTDIERYDRDGEVTSDTKAVTNVSADTPAVYTVDVGSVDGTKFEAKTNIFDVLDKIIDSLNQVDSDGNPVSIDIADEALSKGLEDIADSYDGVNVSHAKLGARNQTFEVSYERLSAKLTQFNILSQEIGAADLSKVAVESKALELTYTALYSTINKTSELSLVNFI